MAKLYVILLLGIFLVLGGCATTYNPATGQKEFIFITTPAEVSMGNMVAEKIARQFEISNDAVKLKRIREIGKRIAEASDRKNLKYQFNIIEDDSLNAFTSPGGYVYINSGVLEKSTDEEFACVIGHEVGHIAARHIAKKLQAQLGYDIFMNIAMRKTGIGELQKAVSLSYDLIMLGYTRQDELLADRLGVKYVYKAGYDPYAMISFLEKLKNSNKKEIGLIFLRSHPYISDRIKMMEMQIPVIIERVAKKGASVAHVQKETFSTSEEPVVSNKERPRRVMCPVCRRIFPGSTNYCPYDGTKLQ